MRASMGLSGASDTSLPASAVRSSMAWGRPRGGGGHYVGTRPAVDARRHATTDRERFPVAVVVAEDGLFAVHFRDLAPWYTPFLRRPRGSRGRRTRWPR